MLCKTPLSERGFAGGSGEIREEERSDDDLAIFRGVGDAAPRKERHAKECRSSPLMLWKRRCVRHKGRTVTGGAFGKGAGYIQAFENAAGVLHCKPPNFAPICRFRADRMRKTAVFRQSCRQAQSSASRFRESKKAPMPGCFFALAEAARFELADGCPSPHFECGSL